MDWTSFFLGVSFTLWGATILGVSYVLFRYVYTPWKIMRGDVKALNSQFGELRGYVESELGLRKALTLTDEEEARREQHARTRRAWGVGPQG